MNLRALRLLLLRHSRQTDDKECDCGHPTWLALALAIFPAVLPVLVEKLGNLLMRWLFDNEDEEQDPGVEQEDEEPKKKKKSKKPKNKKEINQ